MAESDNWQPLWLSKGNRSGLLVFVSYNNTRIGHGRFRVFLGTPIAEGETTKRLPECKVITADREDRHVPRFTIDLHNTQASLDPVYDCERLGLQGFDIEQGMLSATITKK